MRFLEIFKRMHVTNKCLLCHEPIGYGDEIGFCVDCIDDWNAFLSVKCVRCGYKIGECTCVPRLIRESSNYGFITCAFYSPKAKLPANKLIYTLKRDFDTDLINFMAKMMVKNLLILGKRHGINFSEYTATFVTRRNSGKRKYGFDHTEYLAKYVAKRLGIKCERTISNVGYVEQKSLTKNERLENAQISFEIYKKSNVKGRKFLLIDDIITSGATMRACIDILKENGAAEVIPVSFAKDN